MADVTNTVIATEGFYKLQEGDAVDFGALFLKLLDKTNEWDGVDDVGDRSEYYCRLYLVSCGFSFEVELYGSMQDARHRVSDNASSIPIFVYVNMKTADGKVLCDDSTDPNRIELSRMVSCDTVLISSEYGKSRLDGIAIEYPDEVPLADRFSA